MAKHIAVFGLYATPDIAETAVDHLLAGGFSNSDISVLLPDDDSTRAFAHEKHTKAPEGTATGAATGGVIGGTLGLLAGIGALAIPGVGPLIAAGPIVAALAGVGAGGALGGVVGALVGMGIPEYEAKRFAGAVKDGGTLLSVHCETSEEVTSAKQLLRNTGAHDIAASGEEGSASDTPEEERKEDLSSAYLANNTAPGDPIRTLPADNYELENAYRRERRHDEEELAATGTATTPRYPR